MAMTSRNILKAFYEINRKWPLCVHITLCKHSREFGRIQKYLGKASPVSNSPKLPLVFASSYVNTHAIFYFLNSTRGRLLSMNKAYEARQVQLRATLDSWVLNFFISQHKLQTVLILLESVNLCGVRKTKLVYWIQLAPSIIGSISAAHSSPVFVPPRDEFGGRSAGSFSRTAAGNWAYLNNWFY